MRYERLLKIVAQEHNTTPEEVDNEIRVAIKSAGYDMSPELFIALTTSKIKNNMNIHEQ